MPRALEASRLEPDAGLQRGLRPLHVLAIVVGSVVGTNIYIRPASIAQLVATPAHIFVVWAGAGLLTLAGALTYSQLVTRIPRSGGEYAFLHETLGELPAFLFGWMRLTVGAGGVAGGAVAFTVFLGDLIPLGGAWFRVSFIEIGARQVIAVLVIAVLACINMKGVGGAGRFQTIVTAVKVIGLLLLIGAALLLGQVHGSSDNDVAIAPAQTSSILTFSAAMLAALAAFNGWANAAMVAGEVQDPQRNLPRALTYGIIITIGLYLAANLAYLWSLPMQDIVTANSTAYPNAPSVAGRMAIAVLGERFGIILPFLFLISVVGALHCQILSVPRVYFAMARDGLLPARLARLTDGSRTPNAAIGLLALVGSILAVLGSVDRLINMSTFGALLFYALNAFGLLRLLHRSPIDPGDTPRSRTMAIPALFLAGALWLLVTLVLRGMAEITTAIALMGLGIPAYFVMRLRRRASMSVRS